MALKFLNKKGWHTGSLRNIENVWKAEQKHDAEQKKLEELRKQIHEERERSEFRLLQEQAGLVPKQERLDFLYDSGLAVGKSSSEGFKALETFPKDDEAGPSSSAKPAVVPGALFEERPQSANDAWRKLHSDPLLMIRQREQESLARIRNNPVQMAMIRKSMEATKHEGDYGDRKGKKKHQEKDSGKEQHSLQSKKKFDSEKSNIEKKEKRESGSHRSEKYDKHHSKRRQNSNVEDSDSDKFNFEEKDRRKSENHKSTKYEKHYSKRQRDSDDKNSKRERQSNDILDGETISVGSRNRADRKDEPKHDKYSHENRRDPDYVKKNNDNRSEVQTSSIDSSVKKLDYKSQHKRQAAVPKLSEEERAAKLREMQIDAELHEEQRWKRLKRAEEDDAREAARAGVSKGKNFLDATQKSIYGAEKGGSSTIEESVRRRAHYSQGRLASDGNAFRR